MPPNPAGPEPAVQPTWSSVPGFEGWQILASSGGPGHAGSSSGTGVGQQMPQQPVQPAQVVLPPQVPLQPPQLAFPPQPVLPAALPAQAAPKPLLAFFLAVQVSEGP